MCLQCLFIHCYSNNHNKLLLYNSDGRRKGPRDYPSQRDGYSRDVVGYQGGSQGFRGAEVMMELISNTVLTKICS